MATLRIKGLKQSGRVSVAKARKAVEALKSARRTAGTESGKAMTVTAAKTATGRQLIRLRTGAQPPTLAS